MKMRSIEHKTCGNCGARMIYNNVLRRWECKLCGNIETLFIDLDRRRSLGVG